MQAWIVDTPRPIDDGPLRRIERDRPEPGPTDVLVRISCCGVCRTDLHLAEGDLPPRRPGVTPGHEVVGRVEALGSDAGRFSLGERVGVPWLGSVDGTCRYCRRGAENLCSAPTFTGWDRDGGYADACVVDEGFAYRLPATVDDEQAAPLLCAGIIGYRAWRSAAVPARRPAGHLRLRRQRPHHRADRAAHGPARARAHPRRAQPGAGPLARRRLRRRCDGRAAGAARRRHPVRSGRRARPRRAAGPRPWRHPGGCRDLALRHPHAELRARAVPGAPAAQRHREHPQDGEEFLALAERFRIRRPPSATRWIGRRRPWPTLRTAASAAQPSCTTAN